MSETPVARCVSCGAEQPGAFCPECGERRITAADRTVGAFLRRAFEDVTDVDSRLIRTLRQLVFSPGALTRAFANGRRKPFLSPVQLFLLANLAYFLVQPLSSYTGYNTPLQSQIERQSYSDALPVAEWVDTAQTRSGLDAVAFEAVYNNQSELLARTLIISMVPLFALILVVLALGKRKPFVDHVVFALHFYAFDLLVMHCMVLMVWPHLIFALAKLLQALGHVPVWLNAGAGFLMEVGASLLITVPYLYFAYRRFYEMGVLRAAALAFVSLVLLYLTTAVYRLLLLLITLATV